MDRAGSAHVHAASVLRSRQVQEVAQDPEQGHLRIRFDPALAAIDRQSECGHGLTAIGAGKVHAGLMEMERGVEANRW